MPGDSGRLGERLLVDADRLVPVVALRGRDGGEHRFPGGDLVGLTGLAAEREHEGVGLERDGPAFQPGIMDEDQLAGPEVVLVPVDGETGTAAEHEVDLLVAEAVLGVLLDHHAVRRRCAVPVHAEGADAEVAANRPPDEAVRHFDRLELVDRATLMRAAPSSAGRRESVRDRCRRARTA